MNRSPAKSTNTTHDTIMAISIGVFMAAASLMYDAPTAIKVTHVHITEVAKCSKVASYITTLSYSSTEQFMKGSLIFLGSTGTYCNQKHVLNWSLKLVRESLQISEIRNIFSISI
jgi:hypothetical protein